MRTRHLALLALAAALLWPAAAPAAWGPPQDMGPLAGTWAYDGNARGDRILVWESDTGLVFSKAGPGEAFGPPAPLRDAGPTRFSPRTIRVELDERGNALLVWSYFDDTDPEFEIRGPGPCCTGLRARVIRRDGTSTATKTLAPRGNSVHLADMQIAPDGAIGVVFARVAYENDGAGVDARVGTVARGFGAREGVLRGYDDGPLALSFVRRRARILYTPGADPYYSSARVAVRELERRGKRRWRRLADALPATTMVRDRLRFATAPNGQQVASWMSERRSGGTRVQSIYAAARTPGRRFRVRRLARDDFFDVAVPAIEPTGNALTAWFSPIRASIVAAARRPGAGFGPLTRFAHIADRTEVFGPGLDVNRRGHALIAWIERTIDENYSAGRPRLVAAFRNSRGSPLEHHAVEPEGPPNLTAPAVSLDRAGRGHVVYVAGLRLKVIAGRIGG